MPVSLPQKTKDQLDALLSEAVKEGKVPGASLVVGSPDTELYFGASGVQSFGDPSAGNVDRNSIFWVCSHTKLVVTIAFLQLIEAGKLTYDTPAAELLPELADPVVLESPLSLTTTYTKAKNPILVKHLLNHSSGIVYSTLDKKHPDELNVAYTSVAYVGEGPHGKERYSRAEFFRLVKRGLPGVPLSFEPGTNWAYGYGCDLLVFILEDLTGKTIQEYCDEHLFAPLKIKPTFYINSEIEKDLVQLTFRRRSDGAFEKWTDQLSIPERQKDKMGITLGGIAMHSTLSEYLAILQHLLLIKENRASSPILSHETVNLMFKSSVPPASSKALFQFTSLEEIYPREVELNFGLGICLAKEDWDGRKKKGSGFWYGWAGTYYFMDPQTGIAAVYGTQLVPTFDTEVKQLWDRLERALYAGLQE
ncbi:beta-lactamase/transpeptidase-like protein [Agrocybe pediades]|nr:beta-lactamase/transpeptidase-like protein [Agrocybe pediades]